MRKSEIFDIVLAEVCKECEVPKTEVIGCSKVQTFVEARVLAVQYLHRLGLSYDDIALVVLRECAGNMALVPNVNEWKSKSRAVAKLFSSYTERCLESKAFRGHSTHLQAYCSEVFKEPECVDTYKD